MEIVVDTLTNVQANSLSWIIQTEDPPPRELLESLTSLQITLLPGRLTESEMSGAFAKVDLICLPYDVEMYRLNASALAYRAADNLTAVATFKGSAFGNEIEKFGIGLVVEDLNALKDGLSKFDTVSCRTQIFEYNKVRLQSNRDLLTW
jgi:hypothetical protein